MGPLSRTGLLAGRRVQVPRPRKLESPPDLQLFCKALERRRRPCRSDSFVSRTPSPQSALSDLLRHCSESPEPDTTIAKARTTPPTPPPTLISRRCLTPDRPSRPRLILDLRRSRSHDKLDSASTAATSHVNSHTDTPVKSIPTKMPKAVLPPPVSLPINPPPAPMVHVETTDDVGICKRRGKRLKRRKAGRGKDADIGFQGLSEPDKTQVSTLEGGGDAEAGVAGAAGRDGAEETADVERTNTLQSFLDSASLQYLHRGLNAEAIHCEVLPKRKAALEETARVLGLPNEDRNDDILAEDLDKNLDAEEPEQEVVDPLSQLPRVSTWADSVFSLPMNTKLLHTLTPLDYLRNHVTLSSTSVALYKRIFCKFSHDHILPVTQIQRALSDLVGRSLTEEEMVSLHDQLSWSSSPLDFRTWCGVAAAAERLACIPQVCGRASPAPDIERADMATMERYLASLPPGKPIPPLAQLLRSLSSGPKP